METYKYIPNYEGIYQVSNLGNVKSLKFGYEKILKGGLSKGRYLTVSLNKNGNRKTYYIHKLVAMTFLNHKPKNHTLVIDHIDNNKLNNKLSNLQIITHRENSSKDKKGCYSKYTGVTWRKNRNKWQSSIKTNGVVKYLGNFKKEYDAHLAYQKALKEINNDRRPIT
jgi:hypothetical protein